MAGRPTKPEQYLPVRIAEEAYYRAHRPKYADLAHAAGQAVADKLVTGSLVGPRHRAIKPVPMEMVSRHAPEAPNAFPIYGIAYRHPMRAKSVASYWGFRLADFDHAVLREPEEIAITCVDSLRKVLDSSPLWDAKNHVFRSSSDRIGYNDLAISVAEAAAIQPEGPLTTETLAEYAAQVGGRALLLATGSDDTGTVQMFPRRYTFIPKAQDLRPAP